MKPTNYGTMKIDTTFNTGATFNTTYGETIRVTTSDHRELTHRDSMNQHPIDSITNLDDELEVRPDEQLSNIDIYEIVQR